MTQTVTVEGVGDLEFPDGMSQDDMAKAIQKNFPQIHKQYETPMNVDVVGAPLEAAAHMISGGISVPVSGYAGLLTEAGNKLGLTDRDPTQVIQDTQQALTIPPHTKLGQDLTKLIEWPIAKYSEGADYAGGKVAQLNGSPALGAGVNAAIVAAPAALGLRSPRPTLPAEVKAISTTRAIELAKDKTSEAGINWAALPGQIRKQITDFARDSTQFESITPDMLKRYVETQKLPVPVQATKGQLSRDPLQLRDEQQLAQTREGTPIRDVHIQQNQSLLDNIDVIKGKQGARANTSSDVGRAVDNALRSKMEASKSNYEKLYNQARNSAEGNKQVSVKPLTDYLNDTLNPGMTSYIESALKKMKAASYDDNGVLMPNKDIPLKQLEEVRKLAVKEAMDGGTKGHYAGEVISKIDEIMEKNGGEKYQQARSAFKQHQMQYGETGAVANILDKSSRVDRKTAFEDVFDRTVLKGSTQDLINVRDALINDQDKTIAKKGRQAYRELSGQTVEYIKDMAANKFVGSDEIGNKNVSASGLKKALDNIGDEKLDLLFGRQTRDQLRQIQKVTEDLKTSPPKRIQGSDTAINVMAMLNRALDKVSDIPVVGKTAAIAKGTVELVKRAGELGEADKTVRSALMEKKPQSGGLSLKDYAGNLEKSPTTRVLGSTTSQTRINKKNEDDE